MASSENVAFTRRLDAVEREANGLQLLWVRTTIVVYGRQSEPTYNNFREVNAAAVQDPEPVEQRTIPDLELLIDPLARIRKLRSNLSPAGQDEFDDIKQRAQLVDVKITCHAKQLGAVLSDSPTTAAIGGNRAGKSMILVWWLFRRWMMRGGPGRMFWWVSPSVSKRFAQGVYAIAGQKALGCGWWPDELMVLPKKGIPTSVRVPRISMIDGSVIEFKHAAGDGGNLKSENVVDVVLDELGEIDDVDNFHQAKIRVSQTGGAAATATTRKRGHWMDEEITKRAKEDGPEVVFLTEFDLFDSPWMTYARIFRLFVNDKTLTKRQLEREVLPLTRDEQRAKCLELARNNPKSLREHFGIETSTSRLMWTEWSSDLIYHSELRRHPELVVNRDGDVVRLINITREVMARKWPHQTANGSSYDCFGGVDFNVRGHAVLMELFGEGRSVAEALANEASWTVLVTDEVQVDGTTERLAQQIKTQAGKCPIWYDPHGAKGHAARGTGHTSDAAVLRQYGHAAAPANGTRKGKPQQLPQTTSRNVMHALMHQRRYFVHSRCVGTVDAMQHDLAKLDGRADKRSSPDSVSDLRSGFSDSVRYGLWNVARSIVYTESGEDENKR